MKKLVRLTESDLVRIIEKVISEQDTVGGNFQQGVQSGQQAGQQARQVVNKVAGDVAQGAKKVGTAAVQAGVATLQGAKQVAITIGKVTFYAVITGGVVVFLIGKGIYKVSAAVGNAIIKFLAATGKATVSAATAVGQKALGGLQAAGIAIGKGAQFVAQQLGQMKDSTVSFVKWMINQFKQFGTAAWAKILVAASQVKEWGSAVAGFLKQSWNTIANKVGVAWDQAANWASGKLNQIKQGVQTAASAVKSGVKNAASAVKSGVQNVANSAANVAGNVWGGVKGFFTEMFERYLAFEGTNILEIISEAAAYNGKSIL